MTQKSKPSFDFSNLAYNNIKGFYTKPKFKLFVIPAYISMYINKMRLK